MENINNKDVLVLAVIDNEGGEASASTLREKIDWMESTGQSSYRLDKLQEAGMIDTEYRSVDHTRSRWAVINDTGDAIIRSEDIDEVENETVDEVDPAEYERMKSKVAELEAAVWFVMYEYLIDDGWKERRRIDKALESYKENNAGEFGIE